MKNYKLVVVSDWFRTCYNISAKNLQEAGRLAHVKFIKEYHQFNNIRVSLHKDDINNHIDEILQKLYIN